MKKWIPLLLAAFVLSPYMDVAAQGVKYQNFALDSNGDTLKNTTIRVCDEPASGATCTPLASVFSDKALTNGKVNPFTSDSGGIYFFYAAPGLYHIQITSGSSIITFSDVVLVEGFDAGVINCSGVGGTDLDDKITNCLAIVPTAGGTLDFRGITGAQAVSADPFSGNTKPIQVLFGPGTVTFAAGFDVSTQSDISFIGSPGTIFTSTSAITIVDADTTTRFRMQGILFTGTPTEAISVASSTDAILRDVNNGLASGVFIDEATVTRLSKFNVFDNVSDLASIGDLVVNEDGGANSRFRVETDTLDYAICTDSVNDRIGVGMSGSCTPAVVLDIRGAEVIVSNPTDADAFLTIDSGSSAPQGSCYRLSDRGTVDYRICKENDGDLVVFEVATGLARIELKPAGNITLRTGTGAKSLFVRDNAGNVLFTVADGGVVGDVDVSGVLEVGTGITINTLAPLGNVLRGDGTNFVSAISPVFDFNHVWLMDEFQTDVEFGQLHWTFTDIVGVGAVVQALVSTFDHPGQLRVASGGTPGDSSTLVLTDNTSASLLGTLGVLGSNSGWDATFIVKLPDVTGTESYIGFSDQLNSAAPSDVIWFRFDDSADTFWTFETCSVSSCTVTASAITPVADTFYRLRVRSTVTGQILFSIDGGSETTLSTNVPTVALGPYLLVINESSDGQIEIDRFQYKAIVSR